MPTLSASSRICKLFIRLFQSSLAFVTLDLIPSILSLDTTRISNSPLALTVLSLAWPCSLSLKNSCGDIQTKDPLTMLHTNEGKECKSKINGQNPSIHNLISYFVCVVMADGSLMYIKCQFFVCFCGGSKFLYIIMFKVIKVFADCKCTERRCLTKAD